MVSLGTNAQVNVAVNKPVTMDSETSSQPAWRAVDGLNYGNPKRWVSDDSGYPHWIEVDLEEEYLISGINFYTGFYGDSHPADEYSLRSTGMKAPCLFRCHGNRIRTTPLP